MAGCRIVSTYCRPTARSSTRHAARRVVREAQPSFLIDDEDAFDHAREDRLHLRAIAVELQEAAAEPWTEPSSARATTPSSSLP